MASTSTGSPAPARLDLALSRSGHCRIRIRSPKSVLAAARGLTDLQEPAGLGAAVRARATVWAWGSNGRLLNNLVVLGTAYELKR